MKNGEAQNSLKTFQDLHAWQASRKLYLIVFQLTKTFPKEENYVSVAQMRRAALSVSSNLAEGFGRLSAADKLHFYVMVRGSLTELQNQIILMHDVGLISDKNRQIALEQAEITHKLVVGLTKVTQKRREK
jgi:four helix bundle protein